MAVGRTHILVVSIALALALLFALLFPTLILPLLPPVRPLASQLLARLRDVLAFLAFTTVIVAGIFSIQHKDAQSNEKRKRFLEHHPLGSIFGEPGHGEAEHLHSADDDLAAISPVTKKTDMSNGGDGEDYSIDRASSAMVNETFLQKRSARFVMPASYMHRLLASQEEYGFVTESKVQKTLHRKSSSLDDSVNYEPEPEPEPELDSEAARSTTLDDRSPSVRTIGKQKSVKKVSFSVSSSPISSKNASPDEPSKQSREYTAEKQDLNGMSPGDLTRQADAFIARFKEQMRMQPLESFRYRRRVS